jgi:hypothetical protein
MASAVIHGAAAHIHDAAAQIHNRRVVDTHPLPAVAVDIQLCATPDVLRLLASLLNQIVSRNDRLRPADIPPNTPSVNTRPAWDTLTSAGSTTLVTPSATSAFQARLPLNLSIHEYLVRINEACPVPNIVYVALLVYFDRMTRLGADVTGRDFVINSFTVHRLVIAGIMVATKFFADDYYNSGRYAKVRKSWPLFSPSPIFMHTLTPTRRLGASNAQKSTSSSCSSCS